MGQVVSQPSVQLKSAKKCPFLVQLPLSSVVVFAAGLDLMLMHREVVGRDVACDLGRSLERDATPAYFGYAI